MIKKILFVLLFFPLNFPVLAQTDGWFWQNPLPLGEGLGKPHFFTPNLGWIPSETGKLVHTIDAGASWKIYTVDTTIFAVLTEPDGPGCSFISDSVGWVIGTKGGFDNPSGPVLYKTTNRGTTWIKQDLGSGLFGAGVQFLDSNMGWAVVAGGSFPDSLVCEVKKSTDGGDSWSTIYTAPPSNVILGFQFLDANNGWTPMDSISFDGPIPPYRIMHTTDGGVNWSIQFEDNSPRASGVLQFVDLSNGWVVGDSARIFKTTNGGANWTAITNTGVSDSSNNSALSFISPDTGWIASKKDGSPPIILHTWNGGTSWLTQNPNLEYSIFGIQFLDANNGWATSNFGGISQTTSGGASWTRKSSSLTSYNLNGVFALEDGNKVWAVGNNGTILHTTNGGSYWFSQSSGVFNNLKGVFFVNANVGYAVGDFGTILKTADGGNNWNSLATPAFGSLSSVHFADTNFGTIVVEFSDTYLRTTNGGIDWSVQTIWPFHLFDVRDIHFMNSDTGVAVGTGGYIVRTTDGGSNWYAETSGTALNLEAVFFPDEFHGTAVGENGVIVHCIDGGFSWSPQTSGTNSRLTGVFFTDSNNGTVVGDNGTSLKTTDGGANWTKQLIGSQQPLTKVSFAYSNMGWVVGYSGIILAYKQCNAKSGDITGEGDILLNDIVALINFRFRSGPAPNPFCRGDANGDGSILLTDIVYLINLVFRSGPAPVKTGVCC